MAEKIVYFANQEDVEQLKETTETQGNKIDELKQDFVPIFFGSYSQRDGPYILFEFQDEESTVLLNLKNDTNTAVTAFIDGDMYGVNNIKKDNNDQYMIE